MGINLHTLVAAALRSGAHRNTVTKYCRLGLLKPAHTSSGIRLFCDKDIELLRELVAEGRARSGRPPKNKAPK